MSTTAAERVGYSGRQAADAAGITYRQLDYWARTDLIRPSLADARGSGSRRRYSAKDIAMLCFIRQMLDSGVNLDVIRNVIFNMQDELIDGSIVVICEGTPQVVYPNGALPRSLREKPCHTFPIHFPDLRLGTCEHNDYHHLDYPHPPGRACKFWKPIVG